jgi:hypothetical protein
MLYTKEEVLRIIDICFHNYASDYRQEAKENAEEIMGSLGGQLEPLVKQGVPQPVRGAVTMDMELKQIIENAKYKGGVSPYEEGFNDACDRILREYEGRQLEPPVSKGAVQPVQNGGRKIEVIVNAEYFEEFTARTDIEILQVDVKAVEQSYMCQESFLAVIQYKKY